MTTRNNRVRGRILGACLSNGAMAAISRLLLVVGSEKARGSLSSESAARAACSRSAGRPPVCLPCPTAGRAVEACDEVGALHCQRGFQKADVADNARWKWGLPLRSDWLSTLIVLPDWLMRRHRGYALLHLVASIFITPLSSPHMNSPLWYNLHALLRLPWRTSILISSTMQS